MKNKFFIKTMGCQMNEYDSDLIGQELVANGWEKTDKIDNADLVIINTCTVRKKPEHKAYSLIGRVLSMKRKNPDMVIAVIGCLVQHKKSYIMDRFPDIDMIIGPREVVRFLEYLKEVYTKKKRVISICLNTPLKSPPFVKGYFRGKVTAYVSIMQGCNNFCSYCIVPYVRGREISRPVNEILQEVEFLVSEGIKEITLLGQNVNSYKWDDLDFASLLEKISKIRGLLRLRFTTSHPKDLSERLILCFGELENLCPHIHLPFQAGSNKILSLMRRNYTREKYLELIDKLRHIRPDISITSDVMVGFPGETEDDFYDTIDLIKKVEFDNLYSFKYSDRPGTPAEKMQNKVDEKEKLARLIQLQSIQKDITLKKNKSLEGKEVEILVEGLSKKGDQFTGRTPTNKIVNFDGNINMIGKIVKVQIVQSFANSLVGSFTKNVR